MQIAIVASCLALLLSACSVPPTPATTKNIFGEDSRVVIDGLDEESVREAMRVGIEAASRPGVMRITAGNYGGALGQFQFHLCEIMGA